MAQKRRLRQEPTTEMLEDLECEDYLHGILDPERRKLAERHGLLKWTKIYQEKKQRVFGGK